MKTWAMVATGLCVSFFFFSPLSFRDSQYIRCRLHIANFLSLFCWLLVKINPTQYDNVASYNIYHTVVSLSKCHKKGTNKSIFRWYSSVLLGIIQRRHIYNKIQQKCFYFPIYITMPYFNINILVDCLTICSCYCMKCIFSYFCRECLSFEGFCHVLTFIEELVAKVPSECPALYQRATANIAELEKLIRSRLFSFNVKC